MGKLDSTGLCQSAGCAKLRVAFIRDAIRAAEEARKARSCARARERERVYLALERERERVNLALKRSAYGGAYGGGGGDGGWGDGGGGDGGGGDGGS